MTYRLCLASTSIALLSFLNLQAQQVDTIFTFKDKIACTLKEISPDIVKFSYIGEDVIYSWPLSQVRKISFKSGRVQNFSAAPLLKQVRYVADWQNVLVTKNENDVYGLKKFNEISAVAWYGGLQETRKYATKHLQMLAAMKGYKAIVKTFEEEGYAGNAVEAVVSGIPYADTLPSLSKFTDRAGIKTKFKVFRKYILTTYGLSDEEADSHFNITESLEQNGIAYFEGNIGLHEGTFRLVYVGPSYFVLYFAGERKGFNFEVSY